ncbi:MAG TPA: MdtA/MuxA family multidrug efflux RND transporter periplasmic adaptor subunit [Methylophilaceae bacterium]|nr:MdtA/MuxA family multidrug efflux RND transporter periplasmic adaptor subunit [Methylophilaceae bacterium]
MTNPPDDRAYAATSAKPRNPLWTIVKWVLVVGVLAALVWAIVQHRQDGQQKNSKKFDADGRPVPVLVAKAERRDLDVYLDALGTITPRNAVVVRARVDGQLLDVYFREGQMVKAGELLAQIDPRPFEVQLAQASGQLARDKALLENSLIDLERYKTLLSQDSIAKQQTDTQEALVRQYRGALAVDQAQVDNARLQLSYSRITAPISGRIGLRQVDPGNMIRSSDANGIVTITQLQPITALFSVPEDNLPAIMQRIKSGQALPVDAFDRSQKVRLANGVMLTPDNQIDTATGTIKLRAEFGNKDSTLFPNQFVNIRMLVDVQKDATVIPVSALQRGRSGDYVFVVKPGIRNEPPGADKGYGPAVEKGADKSAKADRKGKTDGPGQDEHAATIELRPVQPGHVNGELVAIESGLQVGEIVVTDGTDKLKDGAKVRPTAPAAADKAGADKTGADRSKGANGGRGAREGKRQQREAA